MNTTFEDLYLLIDTVQAASLEILNLSNEIEMIEGLLSAIDISFDEQIAQVKDLSNDTKRKAAKEVLRLSHEGYQANLAKLKELKQTRSNLSIEKEGFRQTLEVGKLEIKSNLLKQELTLGLPQINGPALSEAIRASVNQELMLRLPR